MGPGRSLSNGAMRILMSGATGFLGRALEAKLGRQGHRVVTLTRTPAHAEGEAIPWSPEAGRLDPEAVEGFDAVIHLAGEPIAAGRWTEARKQRILESREAGTRLLAGALAHCRKRPGVMVSASAIGIYGDRGDEVLDEHSPPGTGFLPEVCQAWERETAVAAEAGIRVALLRLGLVLGEGGLLARLAPIFKLGLGGRLGDGQQWMSWVSVEDVVGAATFALHADSLEGPVNVVGPAPVRNLEFTRTLGTVLHRPTLMPVPAFAARLAMGEMADALLFASARVAPAALEAAGYPFRHRTLEAALGATLKAA